MQIQTKPDNIFKKKNLSDWQGSQNVKYAVWEGSEETGVLCHGW